MNSNHLGLFDLTGKVPTSTAANNAAVSSRDAEILRLKDELVSLPVLLCDIFLVTNETF